MKKVTVSIPDDQVQAFESAIQQLNISILKEDEKLQVEEWHREIVEKDPSSLDYISSEEMEKTSFSREK